jgi:hypothetical protein
LTSDHHRLAANTTEEWEEKHHKRHLPPNRRHPHLPGPPPRFSEPLHVRQSSEIPATTFLGATLVAAMLGEEGEGEASWWKMAGYML